MQPSKPDRDKAKVLLRAVCEVTGFSQSDLRSSLSNNGLRQARLVTVHLLRQFTELTYDHLAEMLGRDRSTVFRTAVKAEEAAKKDRYFYQMTQTVIAIYHRERAAGG